MNTLPAYTANPLPCILPGRRVPLYVLIQRDRERRQRVAAIAERRNAKSLRDDSAAPAPRPRQSAVRPWADQRPANHRGAVTALSGPHPPPPAKESLEGGRLARGAPQIP